MGDMESFDPSNAAYTPRTNFEQLEIRTADGVALRADVEEPPAGKAVRGTCILAHALFARRTEICRPEREGLMQACAAEGFRAIAFDFRTHGQSRGPSDAGYDDFVRLDLPAVVSCARVRSDDKPVIVLGHSLGGHVALAAQGTGRMHADAIVAVASTLWIPAFEPMRTRQFAQRWLGRGLAGLLPYTGRIHARRLGLGSDDAPPRFASDLARILSEGRWRSADGTEDFVAALRNVRVPVCAVASEGDRICPPVSAELLLERCAGPIHMIRIACSDAGGRAPDHMGIVTTRHARKALREALEWADANRQVGS